jgi:cytochrome c peroxidase
MICSWKRGQPDIAAGLDYDLGYVLSKTAPTGEMDYYLMPDEKDLAAIPQDPMNTLTIDKVALRKFLFFEMAFGVDAEHSSGQGTYSCTSCHIPEKG